MLDFQIAQSKPMPVPVAGFREIPAALLEALSELSDAELNELEDELDFYAFTGLQGMHIRRLLNASSFAQRLNH